MTEEDEYMLANLDEREKTILKKIAPLKRQLKPLEKMVETIADERRAIYENAGTRLVEQGVTDISILLDARLPYGIDYHQYTTNFFQKLGFMTSGYFRSTGQTMLKMMINYRHQESIDKIKASLALILPHMKPDDGWLTFGILESTLSEDGIWYFLIDPNDHTKAKIMKTYYRKTTTEAEGSLDDMLVYVSEHAYYAGWHEQDDDNDDDS